MCECDSFRMEQNDVVWFLYCETDKPVDNPSASLSNSDSFFFSLIVKFCFCAKEKNLCPTMYDTLFSVCRYGPDLQQFTSHYS